MDNDAAMNLFYNVLNRPNYDITVSLVNSLKLYTYAIEINIQSIVVWHKNKNKFMVITCSLFSVGIFHEYIYSYTKTIHMISTE